MADSQSPFDVLEAYLLARAAFSAEELAFVRTIFQPRRLAAGDFLQRGGDVARHAAFVARGCLRSFVIDAKGKEHVVQFATEQWWLADAISLNTGTPSQYFYAAIEDSDVLLIDPPAQQQLVDRVPGYSAAMRAGLQKHAAAKDLRIVKALSTTAADAQVATASGRSASPTPARSGWSRSIATVPASSSPRLARPFAASSPHRSP